MKLQKLTVIAVASLLALSGCSSNTNTSKTVDGKSVLASINDNYIYADDLFDKVLASSTGAQTLYQTILKEVFEKSNPVTSDMKSEASILKNNITQNYTGKEADLTSALTSMGYTSLDQYIDSYIDYLQYSAFMDDYVLEHYDELFEQYYQYNTPRYVSHILVKMADPENPTAEEQAKLDEVISQLAAGTDFAEVAKNYSDDGSASNGGALGLCDSNTNFVTTFKDKMLELNEGEVSEPVKSEYGYHIIKVTSTNKDELKTDTTVITNVTNWSSDSYFDTYLEYVVFSSYEITYGNETIEKLVTDYVNNALTQRESSR